MKRKKKINYLRIALALNGIAIDNPTSDMIIRSYEQILKKDGKFSVYDAVKLKTIIDKKYYPKSLRKKEKDEHERT